jgi:putative flippase GtrA
VEYVCVCFLVAVLLFALCCGSCATMTALSGCLLFAVADVLLRMLFAMGYVVEYVVENVVEYVVGYLASCWLAFWSLSDCCLVG